MWYEKLNMYNDVNDDADDDDDDDDDKAFLSLDSFIKAQFCLFTPPVLHDV